jgi:hypothetical protein
MSWDRMVIKRHFGMRYGCCAYFPFLTEVSEQMKFSDSLDKKGALLLCLRIICLRHYLYYVSLFCAPDNPVLTLCELPRVTES